MTSQLAPGYTLTLGSQQWTEQVLRISVTLEIAPQVDGLCVWLPGAAPLSAERGDRVELKIDNGESESTVFSGEIDAIGRDFECLRVSCLDAAGVMARFRPAETYENVSAATVIRNLCDAIGVTAGALEDGPDLAFYVADPSRTAWEHVARLSSWGGAIARIDSANTVIADVIDASEAQFALRYGRELSELQLSRHRDTAANFVVAGEAGAGDINADDVLRPSTDFFAGNRPAGPGQDARWRFEPALRTARSAATAGAAVQREHGARLERGTLLAFLQPQLRCGSVIEIQDLPDGMAAGPLWLLRVQHEISPRAATTRLHYARGGDRFDPAALLGSLAGVVGGLL